jgi:hypothetical protein
LTFGLTMESNIAVTLGDFGVDCSRER